MNKYEERIKNIEEIAQPLAEAFEDLHKRAEAAQKMQREAAEDFENSYDKDAEEAYKALINSEGEAAKTQEEIRSIDKIMTRALIARDEEEIRKAELKTKELQTALEEKNRKTDLLRNYRPTGDGRLFEVLESTTEHAKEEEKRIAEEWEALRSAARKAIENIEAIVRDARVRPHACAYDSARYGELYHKHCGDHTLEDARKAIGERAEQYKTWVESRARTLLQNPLLVENETNQDVLTCLEELKEHK